MKKVQNFEYPEELVPAFKKAKKLEWITIAYLISTMVAIMLTMGNSQAMKTAWFEDLISFTPSISFLIASKIFTKPTNAEFPYGYHRVVSIAYLCSALALFFVGSFLLIDSVINLIKMEHPTIGTVVVFGKPVWLGYLMIMALLWSTFPAILLGKNKLPLAKKLHEKNLYTDAQMNKADWMTASAAIFGIMGIGIGWWWADSLAAALISLDIIHDGYTNLKQAVLDLMNQAPKTVTDHKPDPLIDRVKEVLEKHPSVKEHIIRLREEGHVYFGEGFIVPVSEAGLTHEIESITNKITQLDWRIQEFIITPVKKLPEE
jgi:cation diffusion facilitator family transporter